MAFKEGDGGETGNVSLAFSFSFFIPEIFLLFGDDFVMYKEWVSTFVFFFHFFLS